MSRHVLKQYIYKLVKGQRWRVRSNLSLENEWSLCEKGKARISEWYSANKLAFILRLPSSFIKAPNEVTNHACFGKNHSCSSLSQASPNIKIIHTSMSLKLKISSSSSFCLRLLGIDGCSLFERASNQLLLLGLEKKLISFMSFGCKVALICQQLVEVDNVLINEHASDTASKGLAKGLINNAVDTVTNIGLSVIGVSNVGKGGSITSR